MDIISFWFDPNNLKKWFCQDKIFDNEVYQKFNDILDKSREKNFNELYQFDQNQLLEYIILFDQISRNIYRINKHEYRNLDDFVATELSFYYIDKYGIDIKQEYFYFLILPLRHSKNSDNCIVSIYLIDKYEKTNTIVDQNVWLNFKCASYRSYYDSSSHLIIDNPQKFKTINDFKQSVEYYEDIIDPIIKNINCFSNYDNTLGILYNELFDSIIKYYPKINNNLCVSLSGGVDSMCIAHILSIISKKQNIDIHAVHIKHSNRIESFKEAEMIKEYCLQLGIKYHQLNIDHIQRHSINREFYETETRRIRFDFYNNIKTHYNIELFALGHHKGDIAENVLTNLIKGRTILDLPVMKEFDKQEGIILWRPFLNISKSEILNYAKENGIIYTKNSTPDWSVRGKMRNIIFPTLNNMFNSVEFNLYNAGNESRELFEFVKTTVVDSIFKDTKYGKLGFYFPIEKLKNAGITIWKLTLQKILYFKQINIMKDHIIRNMMKMENKIINHKNYISYYQDNKIIFLDKQYFNITDLKDYKIDIITSDNKINTVNYQNFTIDQLIDGKLEYELFDIDTYPVSDGLTKQMKQRFNTILPIEILNKYVWLSNDYHYYVLKNNNKSVNVTKTIVKITY